MNSYHAATLSTTTGANRMVVFGALAAQLALSGPLAGIADQGEQAAVAFEAPYRVTAESPTFDHLRNVPQETRVAPDVVEQVAARFYARLVENQEGLGEDLERVLHENLWDLYEA